MSPRTLTPALALVVAAWVAGGATPLLANENATILVIEGPGTTAPRPREIRPAIEHAVRQAGVTVIAINRVPAHLLVGCADVTCATRAGAAGGATHVVLVEAAYVDDGHKIRLELFDVKSGRQLGAEGQICEVCPFPAFLKALRESTSLLCTRGLRGPATDAATPTGRPDSVEPLPAPAPDPGLSVPEVSATTTAQPPLETPSTLRRILPRVGVGVGIAAALLGAYLFTQDGKPACDGDPDRCPYVRDTVVATSVFLGLGVAITGASGFMWATTPASSGTIGLPASGFTVAGRF
jgi:hypothetical protein